MQANSGDPDKTLHFVASDLGLHYLPLSPTKRTLGICGLKMQLFCLSSSHKSCRFVRYIVEIIFLVKVH